MNNTLNNNLSKTNKTREVCTFSNPYDPIVNAWFQGINPVPMLWTPSPIELTFYLKHCFH
jgi:hypothetical protein